MKRTWFVMAVALLLTIARGLIAAPFDTRVPADAQVYVAWQGADALTPQYSQSNLKGFVESSKLPDYIAQNWPKWMAAASGGDPNAAQDAADAQALGALLWHHPTAFYCGPIGMANPDKPAVRIALLCDAGADAASLEQLAKKLIAKTPPSPDDKVALTRDGNIVIFTLGEVTPAMLSVGDKTSRLAGAPGYVAATKTLRPNAALTVYVDAEKLIASVTEGISKAQMPPEAQAAELNTIKALGLPGLTQCAYVGAFDQKDWTQDVFIGTKGPRTGILSLLDAPALSDDAFKLIPKDAAAFSAGRLDLTKLFAEVRSIIKQVVPEHAQDFEQGLTMASAMSGVQIEKELIDALGDEWVLYRAPRTEEMTSHPPVFVQKLRDAAALERTLATLGEKITAMSRGKVAIEKLDTGSISVSGVRLPLVTIAWTVRGDYFYVSTLEGISHAVEHVEKGGPSILENPDFIQVVKSLPAKKPVGFTFDAPGQLYPDTYQLIMAYLPMARLAGVDIPGNLIPVPKRISPFLSVGGSIAWSDNDGFHYSGKSAFPGAGVLSGQVTAAVPALAVSVLLPAMGRSREVANRCADAANLRGIMNSAVIWAAQNNDNLPDHVGRLLLDGMSPKLLVSKRAGTTPLVLTDELKQLAETDFDAFAKKVDEHCDFVYLGKGMKNTSDASILVAFEKPRPRATQGINMAFGDVHVDFLMYNQVRGVLEDANKYLKDHNLTEIDVDALMKAAPGRASAPPPSLPSP